MTRTIECTTVLLDAGGIFYIPDHSIALNAARAVGATIDETRIDTAHYAACVAFETRVVDGDPHVPFWTPYLERYASAVLPEPALQTDFVAELRAEFTRVPIWQRVAPGSIDGLSALQRAGVRLGVVSNHNGTLEAMLRRDGIASTDSRGPAEAVQIETIVDSHVVGHRKPSAEIFRCALTAMNVTPAECIYVGDMPAIDVIGAQAAMIRPFIMDPFEAHGHNESFTTIRSLGDLASTIAIPD